MRIVYLILLCSLVFGQKANGQTNPVIDSLQKIADSKKPDSIRVFAYSELCWEYRNINQQKAIANGLKAVKLSRKNNYKAGLSKSLNDLSIIYIDQTKLDTALILLNQTLQIRTQLKDSIGIGAVHNKIGIIYQTKLELKKALEHNLKALDIFQRKKIEPYVVQILNNIGIIHFNLKNYTKALDYYMQCITIRKKNGDKNGLAGTYVNTGNLYLYLHDTTKSIEYISSAIKIFKEVKNERDLSFACHDLGGIYNVKKEFKKAISYIKEALELRIKLNDQRAIASTLILSGEAYTGLSNFDQAKADLKQALQISISNKLPDEEKFSYQKLAMMYAKIGMADSVFHYYSKYENMNNNFYQKNISDKVLDLQEKYDAVAREKKILASENEKQLAQIKSQKLFRWVYILIICIVGAVGFFTFKAQRDKRIAQKKLTEATLAEKEAGLKAVFDATEEERKRIAKDLHDGIGQQMTGIKMAWQQISKEINEKLPAESKKIEDISKTLDDASSEVRNISHQMMPRVLTEIGLVAAIDDMLNKTFKHSTIKYEFTPINVNSRFDERIEISLYRVCQELINNIIKHAGATEVMVQLMQQKNALILIVEDNGKGFKSNNKEGIGMLSISSRINTIHGKINYDPGPQTGTLVTIRIPL